MMLSVLLPLALSTLGVMAGLGARPEELRGELWTENREKLREQPREELREQRWAKNFPEELRDELREQPRDQLRDQHREQPREKLWEKLWAKRSPEELRDELREQLREQPRDQPREEPREKLREQRWAKRSPEEPRDELRDQHRDQPREESREKLREELRKQHREQRWAKRSPEELRDELREHPRDELRDQPRDEHRDQHRDQPRDQHQEQLWAEPPVLVVEFGRSVNVTLRAECRNGTSGAPNDVPKASEVAPPDMETHAQKELVRQSPGMKILTLLNVTEWNSTGLIFHTCPGSSRVVKTIPVIVYDLPPPKLISSRPDLWQLRCNLSATAPLGSVTLTLNGPDGSILASRRFHARGSEQPDKVSLDHERPVRVGDNGSEVTCGALLETAKVTSKPLILNLSALPEDPHLSSPDCAKLDTPFTISCSVRPDVRVAQITLLAQNQTLLAQNWTLVAPNQTLVAPNQTLVAQNRILVARLDQHGVSAEVSLGQPGSVQLECRVRVGSEERSANSTVHVSGIPKPLLTLWVDAPAAGSVVSGHCSLPEGTPGDVQLQVLTAGRVLASWARSPLPFEVPTGEEDEELELSCQAWLQDVVKNSSLRVLLRTKPRLDPQSCPAQQNWTEGQEEILECQSRGHPDPVLECSRDGHSMDPGIPHLADRAQAGLYLCRARNELGTAERNVTLRVLYHDPIPLLPVLLGVLLPVLTLLTLAGLYVLHHRHTKMDKYRLWKRQRGVDMRPLRPPGSSEPAAAPNGSADHAP